MPEQKSCPRYRSYAFRIYRPLRSIRCAFRQLATKMPTEHDTGVVAHVFILSFDLARVPCIISIEKSNIGLSCHIPASVAGGCCPDIEWQINDMDPVIISILNCF